MAGAEETDDMRENKGMGCREFYGSKQREQVRWEEARDLSGLTAGGGGPG